MVIMIRGNLGRDILGETLLRARMGREIVGVVFHAGSQFPETGVTELPGSPGADASIGHGVEPAY